MTQKYATFVNMQRVAAARLRQAFPSEAVNQLLLQTSAEAQSYSNNELQGAIWRLVSHLQSTFDAHNEPSTCSWTKTWAEQGRKVRDTWDWLDGSWKEVSKYCHLSRRDHHLTNFSIASNRTSSRSALPGRPVLATLESSISVRVPARLTWRSTGCDSRTTPGKHLRVA